ncbi:MAG: RNA methyltransferase [Puniceicoccales bacterium]|jgi:TrmH family RNA methyltransferase|nr:RNA methyltransferase [Puniceicoccales bacterium]
MSSNENAVGGVRPVITSRQNPRVLALSRLRERAGRREAGLFLVEGLRELSRALGAGARGGIVDGIYYCPGFFKNASAAVALVGEARRGRVPVFEVSAGVFEKVSGREGADGLMGVARMWPVALGGVVLRGGLEGPPLVLVVEGVEKPGNLGALLRTADAAGCAAVICCDAVVDIFNPNVVRASQGALFSMPCAVASVAEVRAFLGAGGYAVFAAAPGAGRVYWEADFRGAVALVLGSEKDGLSEGWFCGGVPGRGVERICIPQFGLSDSLNVGVAGAVCLFEAVRQRHAVALAGVCGG